MTLLACCRSQVGHPGGDTQSRSVSTPRIRPTASHLRRGRSSASVPALGPGVRIDTHLEEGSTVSLLDSLIAKLIVWAEDRPAGIARGVRALEEIELGGVPTTRGLALDILRSTEFVSGEYSTSFLEEMVGRLPALEAVEAS